MNSTLTFIWCLLEEHLSLESVAQELAKTFHIDQIQARQDIEAALDKMSSEGLFEGGSPLSVRPEVVWQDLLAPQGPAPIGAPGYSHQLNFPNIKAFLTITDSDLLGEMLRIYAPFAEPEAGDAKLASLPALSIIVLDTRGAPNYFDIFINKQRLDINISRERVIPYLVTAIFQKVSKHLEDYLVFHSAALTKRGKTVVFPAHSGAGKSTLCAALLNKGWECLSDELTIIEPENGLIIAMPLPMSIKTGSIDPLRQDYPELSSYPLHQRADGKQVRYLSIKTVAEAKLEDRYTLSSIVIPQYSPASNTVLESVYKAVVLEKMAETGSSERPLTIRDLRGLINIIENTPCYHLDYGSTEAAADFLEAFITEAQ